MLVLRYTDPSNPFAQSRLIHNILGLTQFYYDAKDQTLSKKCNLTDIQAYLKLRSIIAKVVYYQEATKNLPTSWLDIHDIQPAGC